MLLAEPRKSGRRRTRGKNEPSPPPFSSRFSPIRAAVADTGTPNEWEWLNSLTRSASNGLARVGCELAPRGRGGGGSPCGCSSEPRPSPIMEGLAKRINALTKYRTTLELACLYLQTVSGVEPLCRGLRESSFASRLPTKLPRPRHCHQVSQPAGLLGARASSSSRRQVQCQVGRQLRPSVRLFIGRAGGRTDRLTAPHQARVMQTDNQTGQEQGNGRGVSDNESSWSDQHRPCRSRLLLFTGCGIATGCKAKPTSFQQQPPTGSD